MALLIFTVGFSIGLSYPQNWYGTALNERNEEAFWWYLKLFIIAVCISAPIDALESFINDLLAMRSRQILTNMLFDIYMTKRAYYHIKNKIVCVLSALSWKHIIMLIEILCVLAYRILIIQDSGSVKTFGASLMASLVSSIFC